MVGAYNIKTVGNSLWDGRKGWRYPVGAPLALAWSPGTNGILSAAKTAELEKKRPSHGVKRRWRDTAIADLKAVGIKEQDWYALAQDRGAWKAACRDGLLTLLETERYGAHLANFSR